MVLQTISESWHLSGLGWSRRNSVCPGAVHLYADARLYATARLCVNGVELTSGVGCASFYRAAHQCAG